MRRRGHRGTETAETDVVQRARAALLIDRADRADSADKAEETLAQNKEAMKALNRTLNELLEETRALQKLVEKGR